MKPYIAGVADLIVVGSGHAGVEAALAASRLGFEAILFTMDLESVANLPCNPSIGGTAKGQVVREIDAMGGIMGKAADAAGMQFRMLNASKGPAVHSPRAQVDRVSYQKYVLHTLERAPGLKLRQEEVAKLLFSDGQLSGVQTVLGARYMASKVIIATGTYLSARILVGEYSYEGAPDYHFPSRYLDEDLKNLGLKLQRFKTGTPVRIHRSSIRTEGLERQTSDIIPWFFSYENEALYETSEKMIEELHPRLSEQGDCFITWTNEETHKIIADNLDRSPLYSGVIEGTGTRYCPSIEDKIVKFPDKNRHQIFIEPMGENSEELYLQGLSSSMPPDVQTRVLHSIPGLEEAWIQRMGYAIEYTCLDPEILDLDLQSREIPGLYFAGQVVGSSGYEEAAAQGLMAGLNACLALQGKEPAILDRSTAYIGVLIDDLVTRGTPEPYRMMTSRAEYRLLLRQDNADERLSHLAYEWGLIDAERFAVYTQKQAAISLELGRIEEMRVKPSDEVNNYLSSLGTNPLKTGVSFAELLRRPEITYENSVILDPSRPDLPKTVKQAVQNQVKYAGYIKLEEDRLERFQRLERRELADDIDYLSIKGLKREAAQKLKDRAPRSVGQASRISGVSPADISVLLVYLETRKRRKGQ